MGVNVNVIRLDTLCIHEGLRLGSGVVKYVFFIVHELNYGLLYRHQDQNGVVASMRGWYTEGSDKDYR